MSSASGISAETVLGAFTDRGDSAEPLTAGEVADITGGNREIVGERLRSLVERGSLESKQVGGSMQVWWRPSSAGGQPVDQILEAVPVGVVVIDASGGISYANERAEETLGLARSEITDRTYDQPEWQISYGDGTPVPTENHPVTSVLETGETVYEFEHWIELSDGTRRWLSSNAAPAMTDGEVDSVVVGIEDATHVKEREQRLKRLTRLNDVVRATHRAVARAETREQVAETVCDTLLNFEEYRVSTVGEFTASMAEFEVWSRAGPGKGTFEEILCGESGPSRSEGIGAKAARTGELQVCQDIGELPGEDRQDVPTTHGIQSCASIPLVRQDSVYGVIGVFADCAGAFDEQGQRVLSELGEVVADALYAIERKEVLDPVTELTFRTDRFVQKLLGDDPRGDFSLDATVSLSDDKQIRYWTTTGVSAERFADTASEIPGVLDVELVSSKGGTVRFEVVVSEESLGSNFQRFGGTMESVVVEDGSFVFSAQFDRAVDTGAVLEMVRERYPDAELVSQRRVLTETYYKQIFDSTLTERQQTVLQVAYFSGYFDSPRERTGGELADRLGITRQTFHTHLRKAQAQVFRQLLERDTDV